VKHLAQIPRDNTPYCHLLAFYKRDRRVMRISGMQTHNARTFIQTLHSELIVCASKENAPMDCFN
jgi:hypothetical protein